ncbi:hypothetical protein [Legionella jamestowniensis]|uniref:Uncharacterized protein n=1 Tax=Legionella jamestowniensis TaxID=455 RepID=A0A0W0UNL8_9GAMM|nr:hypothetical protein [Legionella jamestowniensis]KTD09429.1 hypothetical protein Ljam_0779 [Legionella jamestowniensis]SFL89175.1 hypothetical protein SAMN02746073_2450 [Legionella jamestowniensis DSM 19215]
MPISPGVSRLFEQFMKSYKSSPDEFYPHIYPKLRAIHKEIKENPHHYSDQTLIARLTSSAIVLKMSPESGFSKCLRFFLIAYEQKINPLHILTEYKENYTDMPCETLEEIPLSSPPTSEFFKELQEAVRQRALRMEEKEKIHTYPSM